MASPTAQCVKRLQIELKKLHKEPDASYTVGADPQNMLHCYFVVNGPEGTPYAGGRYVGLLEIPPDYPFKPPAVQMCTPSGRFATGQHICLSNSSYHPESWSPMWGLRTILVALVSFFVSEESTVGSITSTEAERRKYAANSRRYNVTRLKTVYMRVLHDAYAEDTAFLQKEEEKKQLSAATSAAKQSRPDRSDSEGSDNDHNGKEHNGDRGGNGERTVKQGKAGHPSTTTTKGKSNGTSTTRKQNANSTSTAAAAEPKEDDDEADPEEGAPDSNVATTGDKTTLERKSSQQHTRHSSRHGGALVENLKWPHVLLFDAVPWRRWVSLIVLVVVGFALADFMH